VLGDGALAAPSADRRDACLETLLIGTIGARSQLDKRMERDLMMMLALVLGCIFSSGTTYCHPWTLRLVLLLKVSVNAPQDGLVSYDQDVFAALQLHDDGLKTNDDITITLSTTVTVIIFVIVAGDKIFGISLLDLRIGHAITNTGVKFI
jgi:hypothetical protein